MNYYNPYYFMNSSPFYGRPSMFSGLLSRSNFNLSTILNGAQKTLNIVNQAIPIIKEATPVMKNMKTMFKVMNEFKKIDVPTPKKENIQFNNSEKHINTGPTFFQ